MSKQKGWKNTWFFSTLLIVLIFFIPACGKSNSRAFQIDIETSRESVASVHQAPAAYVVKTIQDEFTGNVVNTSGGSTVRLAKTATPSPTPPAQPDNFLIALKNVSKLEMLYELKLAPIGSLMDMVWSPDGTALAVAGSSGVVLLDGETLEMIRELPTESQFKQLSFSADGRRLAGCGWLTNILQIWDVQEGRSIQTIESSGTLSALSPDGKTLAVVEDIPLFSAMGDTHSLETVLRRYDVETGKLIGETRARMALTTWIYELPATIGLIYSPDGRSLQTSNSLGDVRVWNAVNGQMLSASINPYTRERLSSGLCWVDDSNGTAYAVSCSITYHDPPCSEDNIGCEFVVKNRYEVGFWNTNQIKRYRNLVVNEPEVVYLETVIDPGEGLALLLAEGRLEVWDADQPKEAQKVYEGAPISNWTEYMQDCPTCVVPDMAMKPGSKGRIAAVAYQNRIVLWNSSTNKELASLEHDSRQTTAASLGVIDTRWLVAAGFSNGSSVIYDPVNGRPAAEINSSMNSALLHLAIAPDGKTLVTANESSLDWWTIGGQKAKRSEDFSSRDVFLMNEQASYLAAGLSTYNQKGYFTGAVITVRDLVSGAVRLKLDDSASVIGASQDGRWLAAGNVSEIRLYNLKTGRLLRAIPMLDDSSSPHAIALSPDGGLLAVGLYESGFYGLKINSGEVVFNDVIKTRVDRIAFHPSGCILAAGDSRGQVYLLDLASGQIASSWKAHSGAVNNLAFSRDGRLLISVGVDGAARLWGKPGALSLPAGSALEPTCSQAEPPHAVTPATPTSTPTDSPPTSTPTPVTLTRSLSLTEPNMRGADVLQLQQRLYDLGYTQVGIPDGVFGPKTDRAVRLYQEQNGLVVDGIVGPITWKRLFADETGK